MCRCICTQYTSTFISVHLQFEMKVVQEELMPCGWRGPYGFVWGRSHWASKLVSTPVCHIFDSSYVVVHQNSMGSSTDFVSVASSVVFWDTNALHDFENESLRYCKHTMYLTTSLWSGSCAHQLFTWGFLCFTDTFTWARQTWTCSNALSESIEIDIGK